MKPARSKYGNVKTEVDGVMFDSKAEAARWRQLLLLQQAGQITGLRRQVAFVLAPGVKFRGAARATPALRYVADFGYTLAASGEVVTEDVKGVRNSVYKIKRHLMLALLGRHIVEITPGQRPPSGAAK